jgi:hypothetical protein
METVLEVNENIKEMSDSLSLDDANRKELLWDERNENFLKDIQRKAIENSKTQFKKAKHKRYLYIFFSIPCIIIPLSLSILNNIIVDKNIMIYINTISLVINVIFSSINTFMNYGKMIEQHCLFKNKFNELNINIQSELMKPKKNRQAADMYIEGIKSQFNSLCNYSPDF